jgi:hypothetical protein
MMGAASAVEQPEVFKTLAAYTVGEGKSYAVTSQPSGDGAMKDPRLLGAIGIAI